MDVVWMYHGQEKLTCSSEAEISRNSHIMNKLNIPAN